MCLVLRSEMVRIVDRNTEDNTSECRISGVILSSSFIGRENQIEVKLETGGLLTVNDNSRRRFKAGESLLLAFDPEAAVIVPERAG
ncbi:TOBE domain-containing protein [Neobacillus sp. 114]|uniref:TOBE domain-containing protein n=1 Tax=Neobacillus sp. 114 TaxID=3048535 RepID=UPI0024C367BE|nr:TOBE domain-containing protein [Neobacillus sp. 114]